mmetsp:Transcript_26603/g.79775  ORF Transcript_26603/g.79775 Transcript_26603/m.79775 type:complete len:214 (-) Transcript_26603:97-738(-)
MDMVMGKSVEPAEGFARPEAALGAARRLGQLVGGREFRFDGEGDLLRAAVRVLTSLKAGGRRRLVELVDARRREEEPGLPAERRHLQVHEAHGLGALGRAGDALHDAALEDAHAPVHRHDVLLGRRLGHARGAFGRGLYRGPGRVRFDGLATGSGLGPRARGGRCAEAQGREEHAERLSCHASRPRGPGGGALTGASFQVMPFGVRSLGQIAP